MTFWLEKFRKLDIDQQAHRKMLIDTFINAIYLYDDRLVITYNYKEGTETIALTELMQALKKKVKGSDMNSLGALSALRKAGRFAWMGSRVAKGSRL